MNTAEIHLDAPGGVSVRTLERLRSALEDALKGLPYLFARSSYGDELTLHFGSERAHAVPRLEGKSCRGTHVLSVRGSAWMLWSGIKPVMVGCGVMPASIPPDQAKPFNVTALESGALIGQGATVESVAPYVAEPLNAIGVDVRLSDGSRFMVVPTPADTECDLPEPSDWELLTPSRIIRVGPGPGFSIEDFGGMTRTDRP